MRFLLLLLVFSVLLCKGEGNHYLFSYFTDNGQDGLHLAYSSDGLNWKALKAGKSFLKPTVGQDKLMRDPFILPGTDGIFRMVWTCSWKERQIGYASSRDLVNWSEQISIPVMAHEPTAKNCWAPEMVYDPQNKNWIIFWATTIPGRHSDIADSEREKGLNHRMYCTTTSDFSILVQQNYFLIPISVS
jgi:beta-galactosidase